MTKPTNEGVTLAGLLAATRETLIPDEPPTEAVLAIEAEAEAAAQRVRAGNDFGDWVKIAKGIAEGRRWAMHKAGQNNPVGARYNKAFSEWLQKRPWAQWDKATHAHCLWLADNLPAIEEFRAKMAENVRVRSNHPTVMRRAWDRDHKPKGDKGERDAQTKAAKVEAEIEALAADRDKWKHKAEAAEEFDGVPYDASVEMIVSMFAQNVTQNKLASLAKALTAEAARRAKIKNGKAPK